MSNQPDPNNVQRALRVQRELDAKILKRFRVDTKMTVKDAYILALEFSTHKVKLSADDYRRIADETELAKLAQKGVKK